MRKRKRKMSTAEAYILLIIGLIMGTVFTFGEWYWNAPVEIEDGVSVTASFLEYDIWYGKRRNIQEIKVIFSDYDHLCIDGSCVNPTLLQNLQMLNKGEEIQLIVHPNSDTILQMTSENKTILSFEETQDILSHERNGFSILGILMYASAAYALILLLGKNYRKDVETLMRK